MPLTQNLALVSETDRVTASQLTSVGAALQKQATRDFGPIWGVEANVSAFASLDDVPIDYWPVIVQDDIGFDSAAGIHLDRNGQPFALVQFSEDWSLTASHEVLEMLGDPFGNRLVAGRAPAGAPKEARGRVNFLVEVCDPSESREFAYTVNGVTVSDFYTPRFFDPVKSNVRYSFTDAIKKPRTILQGGYLSWVVPSTNTWFQAIFFGGTKPTFRSLGVLDGKASLRSQIDAKTTQAQKRGLAGKGRPTAARALTARPVPAAPDLTTAEEVAYGSAAKAKSLRAEIQAILNA